MHTTLRYTVWLIYRSNKIKTFWIKTYENIRSAALENGPQEETCSGTGFLLPKLWFLGATETKSFNPQMSAKIGNIKWLHFFFFLDKDQCLWKYFIMCEVLQKQIISMWKSKMYPEKCSTPPLEQCSYPKPRRTLKILKAGKY